MSKRRINFGIMLQGAGINMNSWKHPSVPADASINFNYYIDKARQAEAVGIDFVFIADGLYIHEKSVSHPHFLDRFEPVALLSALAAVTSKIGLVGTVSTSYSEPFTVARQFASIDMISGGRAGWNAVTSPLEGSAKNYSRAHLDHSLRYQLAQEYIEVVKGLWDSWDDDAFIRDRESGRFFDPDKMHRLNHQGRFFSVEGPLNIERSAQGQPLIFQAGSSDEGIRLAGLHADAVFSNGGTFEECRTYYRRVKESAQAQGRRACEVKIFPGVGPIVGATAEEVEAKSREIRDLLSIKDALNWLSHFFEQHDFSVYPLDGPFPDLGDLGTDGFRSTGDIIRRLGRERGLTLREVALEFATKRVHIGTSEGLIGTPDTVADELIRWVEEGAADGFMLGLPVIGSGLDDFVKYVMPVLKERGYHDMAHAGDTLRDHLGLPYRQSRYAVAREAAVV
ncbi:MAG TPA: LLM class flavin-dependent oxidoreductase [Bryobacteraceae bacterium]|nr:LLM class flavin-dependent oxidoreductase [Bryobacteraceae bacterium]